MIELEQGKCYTPLYTEANSGVKHNLSPSRNLRLILLVWLLRVG